MTPNHGFNPAPRPVFSGGEDDEPPPDDSFLDPSDEDDLEYYRGGGCAIRFLQIALVVVALLAPTAVIIWREVFRRFAEGTL